MFVSWSFCGRSFGNYSAVAETTPYVIGGAGGVAGPGRGVVEGEFGFAGVDLDEVGGTWTFGRDCFGGFVGSFHDILNMEKFFACDISWL